MIRYDSSNKTVRQKMPGKVLFGIIVNISFYLQIAIFVSTSSCQHQSQLSRTSVCDDLDISIKCHQKSQCKINYTEIMSSNTVDNLSYLCCNPFKFQS